MNVKKSSGAAIGILLPMGLVCLFAFCSLTLALMGGRAYKAIQAGVDSGYGTTVAASYLRQKLSQNNDAGSIRLTSEGPYQVLAIENTQGDTPYITRIYVENGELRESTQPTSSTFAPENGVTVAYVHECNFQYDEETRLLTANLRNEEGAATRVALQLAGGENA